MGKSCCVEGMTRPPSSVQLDDTLKGAAGERCSCCYRHELLDTNKRLALISFAASAACADLRRRYLAWPKRISLVILLASRIWLRAKGLIASAYIRDNAISL